MTDTVTSPQAATPDTSYVWETLLDVKNADAKAEYHGTFNPKLLDVFAHKPRRMMDIGCAGGMMGHVIKLNAPDCYTIGFELNEAAATQAAQHMDKVFNGKFEDYDLPAEGIAHGSIDTVILADVLEHMYDPWHVMVNLKPFLTADAQIIISLPNTRNLNLMLALLEKGEWTYASRGLLDITHIRFFTLSEFARLLTETGYRIEKVNHFLDGSLGPFYEQNKNKPVISFQAGRMKMENIAPAEFAEMCTWQFFIRARAV